jgi:hypothetical protein
MRLSMGVLSMMDFTGQRNCKGCVAMNKQIMNEAGFGQAVKDVEESKCPFCGKLVGIEDFRDNLSVREYRISGLCQQCQDKFFG